MIPTDQGNSEKDLQITKDIRSAVVGADLSFNTKNIKIITKIENVTLMGVLETKAEHETRPQKCRCRRHLGHLDG